MLDAEKIAEQRGLIRDLTTVLEKRNAEIARLRKIETAARALQFSAYPAHGSGFVMQVHGGNINDLEAALNAGKE